ncbi:MAG: DUF5655 domain-containing protein [Patescibacteria group bacterium]|jgi:hypothetical protein
MWTCKKCGRIFEKTGQPHSCQKIPLQQHFKNKEKAKKIFDYFVEQVNKKVGKCKIISLPCCIHLYGNYDFVAILPKKDGLEIRFAFDKKIKKLRLKQCVLISANFYKICIDVHDQKDINAELMKWLKQSYNLKN